MIMTKVIKWSTMAIFDRRHKQWKRLFFWLIEVVQVNSYILYALSRTATKDKILLKYKFMLVEL